MSWDFDDEPERERRGPRDFEQETETRLYTERVDSSLRWAGGLIGGLYLVFSLIPMLDGLTPLAIYLFVYILYRVPDIRRAVDNRLDVRRARRELDTIDTELQKW